MPTIHERSAKRHRLVWLKGISIDLGQYANLFGVPLELVVIACWMSYSRGEFLLC